MFLAAALSKWWLGAEEGAATIWSDVSTNHPKAAKLLLGLEVIVGVGLLSGFFRVAFACVALLLLTSFIGLQSREITRPSPRACGCFGQLDSTGSALRTRVLLGLSLTQNVACAVGCLILISRCRRQRPLRSHLAPHDASRVVTPSSLYHRRGFTLVDTLICIAIVAVLISLIFPVTRLMQERARAVHCSSNLSQIHGSLGMYALESRGFIPRHGSYVTDPVNHYPLWIVVVANKLNPYKNWGWEDLKTMAFLQCPSHPLNDIPSGYIMNNFAFDSEPHWAGSPPVLLSKVRRSSQVPWILDAADRIGPTRHPGYDGLYFEPDHTVHVPGQIGRVGWRRHQKKSNVLFFDGHVSSSRPSDLPLQLFDDGIRDRRWVITSKNP